jgi:hypothetical protein
VWNESEGAAGEVQSGDSIQDEIGVHQTTGRREGTNLFLLESGGGIDVLENFYHVCLKDHPTHYNLVQDVVDLR